MVLGGLAVEDNLLDALAHAVFQKGYSYEQVVRDFNERNKGVVAFTYDGIRETLSYTPVEGTDWLLTYLVRDSVISERIASVSGGIIRRSLFQMLLTAVVLGTMFAFIIIQTRRNARLSLEKKILETETRIKHQEMEQRLVLQEELIWQQEQQKQHDHGAFLGLSERVLCQSR